MHLASSSGIQPAMVGKTRPHVVIVGAGFGGLAAVQALARVPVDVTVIDRRNFHLFQPLLYQVATAGLTPSDIAWPIRGILRHQQNARVLLGMVSGVDPVKRELWTEDGQRLHYDRLILATGATHNYFGNDAWSHVAPGLKRMDDATLLRRRILLAFERAEIASDQAERQRQLTFVIIGGGPTGVEMAGAIAELARYALATDFRSIDPRDARILVMEGSPRVLATFPAELSRYAESALGRLGVTVRTSTRVSLCDQQGVVANGERVPAATIMWAAGVAASRAAEWVSAPTDRAGRGLVLPDLSVPQHREIFIIGDAAAVSDAGGTPVPGIAPAAKQGGQYVAALIAADVAGRTRAGPFRYRHRGSLATIGRNLAVIDFGRIRLKGTLAWWIWGLAHVYFLIGLRNRLTVAFQWFYSYLTFGRGARLIAGSEADVGGNVSGIGPMPPSR